MYKDKCFALKDGECIATRRRKCHNCAFYKTVEQHDRSRDSAFARIARMAYAEQRIISIAYYKSARPWAQGAAV